MSRHQAKTTMKRGCSSQESEKIKNCAQDGPEGQSSQIGSTMCNAGLSSYMGVLLSSPMSDKVSMKKKKRRKKFARRRQGAGEFIPSLKAVTAGRIGARISTALSLFWQGPPLVHQAGKSYGGS
jgi:hypothetical protein